MSHFFQNSKAIHFIGIGGIGVSALAHMFLLQKKKVSGSDGTASLVTDRLKKKGAKIYIGHSERQIPKKCDVVIYSHAISGDNKELQEARARGIQTLSYPEALGLVSREKRTIAISGTHGKTTTTGMVAEILLSAKKDPTVVIGSFLSGKKENFIAGKSDLFVAEACEYRKSFLELSPDILAITNIDNDHLDYYKTVGNIVKAFQEIAQKVSKTGFIVANPNDPLVKKALRGVRARIIDWTKEKTPLLSVPGLHNVENAQVASAVAKILGISEEIIFKALKDFKGTWRRQELKGKTKKGAIVYDDYAHHPTEIQATLLGFRALFPKEKIVVLFQPHLYSRTKTLLKEFAKSFTSADEVIIAPIYAAREKNDWDISHGDLVALLKKKGVKAEGVESVLLGGKALLKRDKKGTILITMGAGDVSSGSELLV